MKMSICDINLTSISWVWTNQTLISSWHRRNNGRYPAESNPPGSYTTSVSATIMSRLYCGNWKIKFEVTLFQLLLWKKKFFFKTVLLYLKVISDILNDSVYWERRTKMSPNLSPDVYYPLLKDTIYPLQLFVEKWRFLNQNYQ